MKIQELAKLSTADALVQARPNQFPALVRLGVERGWTNRRINAFAQAAAAPAREDVEVTRLRMKALRPLALAGDRAAIAEIARRGELHEAKGWV